MPTPKKAAQKVRKINTVRKDPRPVVYANNTSITITPWDFAIQFGQVLESTPEKVKVQEEICIYISPQHAKVFSHLIERLIKAYEEKYGPIPEPVGSKEVVPLSI